MRFGQVFLAKYCLLALLGCLASTSAVRADEEDRLYDFTDEFYLFNGVNPAAIDGRREADGFLAVPDEPVGPHQRPVRSLLTLPAYNHGGDVEFFTVLGGGSTSLFTSNAAGRRARQIADASPEYVFPRKGSDPLGLTMRQSVILDMRNGYFSNNPLGLWIHVWISYTPKAFSTIGGKKELADLARRNGRDLDGTPLIQTVGEIDRLFSLGLVTKRLRPWNDPLRYAVCPVFEDPTDGGIAEDQFLADTVRPDGTPLEPWFRLNFLSLRDTGDWRD
jgi:hypothetical protein